MPRITVRFAILFVLLTGAAAAADDAPKARDLSTRIERYETSYVVQRDGAFMEEREWSLRVLKEDAVEGAKQTSIGYSTSIQSAEVLAAYTLKADGRRIDVPKDNYQVSRNSGRGPDSPAFSDRTTMSLIFPDVAVGDATVLRYKLVAKEPMFEGHFSVSETFPTGLAYDSVRVRFDLPADLWEQHEARQMAPVRDEKKRGRRLLEWQWSNPKPVKDERRDFSVWRPEEQPGYALSTFRDYRAIAEAYGKVARPKAKVTPRIQALADEIAGDRKDPHDIAAALYEWVSLNVHYAGNCIGLGAVVPRDLDFVIDNRLGDCKDHATLLQALLAAKGIESSQVLINAGNTYELPKIPVVSMVNHVINWLPAFERYVDATVGEVPFDMVPMSAVGKPVLHVDGYRDGTRVPPPPQGTNEQVMTSKVEIRADGSIAADVDVSVKGYDALGLRSVFRQMPEDRKADLIEEYLRGNGLRGKGTIAPDDASGLAASYHYSAKLEADDVIRPGAGAFAIRPVLFNPSPVSDGLAGAEQDPEKVDVFCWAGRSTEKYEFELPEGMEVLSLPEPVRLSNDFVTYQSSYALEGRTLRASRTLDDRTPGHICSPEMMREYQSFAKRAAADYKAQVLYKLPVPEATTAGGKTR